jgi:hypothetical protein
MTSKKKLENELISALGHAGGGGDFPESELGILPQAKDLEPEGSSLPLPPKRALVYGIF